MLPKSAGEYHGKEIPSLGIDDQFLALPHIVQICVRVNRQRAKRNV